MFSTNVQVEENARYVLTKISEFTQVKIQLYKQKGIEGKVILISTL